MSSYFRKGHPSKTYEYTITAQCQSLLSKETEIATFITPAATQASANCDAPTTTTTSVKKAVRTVLMPGEQYTSPKTGKVMLVMNNIYKQPNGKFAGVGSSNFGWLPAMFAVEVTDLEVDLDGNLTSGLMKTITYGVYVIDAKTYAQAEGTLNYATTLLTGDPPSDANLAKLQDTLRSIRNLPSAAQNLIQQGIADIKAGKTDSGKALVNQGIAQAKTELGRAANKGGNVIGGGSNGGKDLKPLYGLNITFNNAPDSKYGFDAKSYDQLSSTYEQENGVYIPWKAVESGRTDPLLVTVSISGSKYKRDSVTFATQGGGKLPLANGKINPVGGSDGVTTEVYALYPTTGSGTQNIAQVNVVGYTKEMNTVAIVPLEVALPMTLQVLMDSLNLIFGQAVAGFNVQIKEVFSPKYKGTISIGGTGMLSAYTASQKEIINEYAKRPDFSKSTYYVFVSGTPSVPSVNGYMPRARKFGFVFDRTVKTIAHELGHGVFNLQHAFDEKSLPRTGDNLMSYGGGTKLHKYQWDKVHNPDFVLGLLEDDEDAMSKALLNSKYVFMHDDLSGKAYTSNKEKDEFSPEGLNYIDGKLEKLDKAGRKTYIYFEYKWIDASNIGGLETIVGTKFENAKSEVKKRFPTEKYNLLVVFNAKYDPQLSAGLKSVSYREVFYPMDGLDENCAKKVNDYLISSGRKKYVDGLDDALKERADKLLENLEKCKIEKPNLDNTGKARADLALLKEQDKSDQRVYKQETDLKIKLSDNYVDCSEFVNEVVSNTSSFNIGWDCDTQYNWFINNKGESGGKFEDAMVGDIIFWTKTQGSKDLTHTGVLYQKNKIGNSKIIHSTCRGDCSGNSEKKSIVQADVNESGNLWYNDSQNIRYFKYWARPSTN